MRLVSTLNALPLGISKSRIRYVGEDECAYSYAGPFFQGPLGFFDFAVHAGTGHSTTCFATPFGRPLGSCCNLLELLLAISV